MKKEDRKICAGGTSTAKMKMPRLHQGAMHTRVFEGDHKQTGEADQLQVILPVKNDAIYVTVQNT